MKHWMLEHRPPSDLLSLPLFFLELGVLALRFSQMKVSGVVFCFSVSTGSVQARCCCGPEVQFHFSWTTKGEGATLVLLAFVDQTLGLNTCFTIRQETWNW